MVSQKIWKKVNVKVKDLKTESKLYNNQDTILKAETEVYENKILFIGIIRTTSF